MRLLGFVPRADLGPLYAGASAFCFPSLLEGFGFPVLEAIAQDRHLGLTIVEALDTLWVMGLDAEFAEGVEWIKAGGFSVRFGLLVDPLDPEAIAAALDRVLSDGDLAERLRCDGPARAAQYTWARTARLVKEAYRSVMKHADVAPSLDEAAWP